MGHSLIGKNRQGVPLYDLMEYLGTLESITDAFHVGVCGAHLDFDDRWQQWASTWFERMLPEQEKPDA